MEDKLIELIENSIKKNWDRKAFTDFNGESLQYKDVARKIAKMHLLFEAADIRPGDKIALCGRNSGNWCVAFLATITYGAVIVPILHEFKPDNVHHIVNHSEARLLFVGDQVWENLNENRMPALQGIICVKDFTLVNSRSEKLSFAREHLNALFGQRFPMMFLREHVHFTPESSPEQLAVINYTSGTTGFSKGVMLPYRSLVSNVFSATVPSASRPATISYPCCPWDTCSVWSTTSSMAYVSVPTCISSRACLRPRSS